MTVKYGGKGEARCWRRQVVDRCIQNASELISSQPGGRGVSGGGGATVTQTLICIILCVVRAVMASR